jgi:hypothetical protein
MTISLEMKKNSLLGREEKEGKETLIKADVIITMQLI